MTVFAETTLPILTFTVPAGHPAGDVPALGRLTINEAQAVSQQWVVWGCETNDAYDITAATASLFYEAETRALLNGTVAAFVNGGSGGANNAALTIALPSTAVPVWSTRTPASVHLTHVGTFRAFARVTTSIPVVGNISLRMDWGVGDLGRYTSNDTTTLEPDPSGSFRIVDLGLVTIPPAISGAQRWEGRIVASSVSGDRLYIDYFWLVPTTVSGEATASAQPPALATLSVFDSFDQTAGVLTGKVSPIGAQTWTFFSGDTDDWTVTTGVASRATVSDTSASVEANRGRYLSAGTTSYTTVTASMDIFWSVLPPQQSLGLTYTAIALRMIDANNVVRVGVANPTANSTQPAIHSLYVQGGVLRSLFSFANVSFSANSWWTLTVSCDTGGRLRVWWNPRGQPLGSPVRDITNSILATGGALAAGRIGIYDGNESATAVTRLMDSFSVFSAAGTTADAAIFASQSLEVRSDAVVREDATGTVWQPVFYEGDHLQVPPTGREKRLVRFIVKASRAAPGQGADSGIDDINATLAVTPRYLSVPSP